MNKTRDFTSGPILLPLIRFALPVLLAIFLQTMYGAVDLMVVGQFGTPADVSAVSTGSQLMHAVTMVINGLAMGLTVQIGRKIGEGRREEAGRIVGSGIFLFALIGAGASVLMTLFSPLMARMLQAPPEAFDRTVTYLRICSGGAVFIVAYNLVGSVFRGLGDSMMPLVTVALACVANIAGDLLLVGVFHMGTAGAAWATVAAQAFSVLLSLVITRRRSLPFILTGRDIRPRDGNVRRILRLGVPIALQQLLVSISFLALTAIVNSLGVIVSAGVGVAQKLIGFIMLVPTSFSQSITAFTAQNMGAGKPERAALSLRWGIGLSLCVGLLIAWAAFFHGNILAGIFAKDAAVVAVAAEYLKAYAIDVLFTSILFCFAGFFSGRGNTLFVMIQGIAGAFGVRVPFSWYMSRQIPVNVFHVGLAIPASTLLQIVLCVTFYFTTGKYARKKERP